MISKEKVNENIIGRINIGNSDDVKELLEKGNSEVIDFGNNYLEQIANLSSNENLLIFNTDSRRKWLKLYNDNFKLIGWVHTIHEIQRMVLNEKQDTKYVYLTDGDYAIAKMDKNLNILESYTYSKTTDIGLNVFYCWCFKDKTLYMCNKHNKIFKFDENLKLVQNFEVKGKPVEMIASRSIICIKYEDNSINFFRIKDFCFISKHEHTECYVFENNSHFYVIEYNNETKKLYHYDDNLKKSVHILNEGNFKAYNFLYSRLIHDSPTINSVINTKSSLIFNMKTNQVYFTKVLKISI